MIRIRRPSKVPNILLADGKAHLAERMPGKAWEAKNTIYAHATVKEPLFAAQCSKCAFCEQFLSSSRYGDVEHFRPKGTAQQAPGSARLEGYYWLSYEWTNLLVACDDCNSKHKKSFFPLATPTSRATSPGGVAHEDPLLIDPASEEPTDYIRFNRHIVQPVNNSVRGATTSRVLGLNRGPLKHRREEWLEKLKRLRFVAETAESESLKSLAKKLLFRCAQADAEFSAMARDYLSSFSL